MSDKSLDERMIDCANQDDIGEDHELRVAAKDFKLAREGFFAENQTVDVKVFLASYAKAKRIFSEYKGNDFIDDVVD